MEYFASEGFVPKTLAEIGPKSGSVPGAHIPSFPATLSPASGWCSPAPGGQIPLPKELPVDHVCGP